MGRRDKPGNDKLRSRRSQSRELITREALAQLELGYLARRGVRNLIDEDDIVGHPPFGAFAVDEAEDALSCHLGAGLPYHHQKWPLVPFEMRDADGGRLGHSRAAPCDVLQLDR